MSNPDLYASADADTGAEEEESELPDAPGNPFAPPKSTAAAPPTSSPGNPFAPDADATANEHSLLQQQDAQYTTLTSEMLAPAKKRMSMSMGGLEKVLPGMSSKSSTATRLVELRGDDIIVTDPKTQRMMAHVSLRDPQFVFNPVMFDKKSPTGFKLHFMPGDVVLFPTTQQMADEWIAAVQNNLGVAYGKPDLGPMPPTLYEILDVPEDADPEALRLAYLNRNKNAKSAAEIDAINEAYRVLHDAMVRLDYDSALGVFRELRPPQGMDVLVSEHVRGHDAPSSPASCVMFVDSSQSIFYYQDASLGRDVTSSVKWFKLQRVVDVVLPEPREPELVLSFPEGETISLRFDTPTKRDAFAEALRVFQHGAGRGGERKGSNNFHV